MKENLKNKLCHRKSARITGIKVKELFSPCHYVYMLEPSAYSKKLKYHPMFIQVSF